KEGMFGGRDYDYLQVVGPGSAATSISSSSKETPRAVASALLPLGAALVALLFAGLLAASFLRRPAGQKAFWAGGFACFAVAAACEAAAERARSSLRSRPACPGRARTHSSTRAS